MSTLCASLFQGGERWGSGEVDSREEKQVKYAYIVRERKVEKKGGNFRGREMGGKQKWM